MLHVLDVDRSVRFYANLGLTLASELRDHDGSARWAMVGAGESRIMFARADGPIDPHQQAVLLYLYSNDVASLRSHLRKCGLHDAGAFCGASMRGEGRGAFSTITFPPYMPKGEMRVEDPDRYCLLIGQLE